MSPYALTLKQLAVGALTYLGLPHSDTDIAASGASETVYADAWMWANLAAQEFADVGPWPWLTKGFVSVTLPASAYQADLPGDVYRLLSDPSYEDDLYLFEPATLQQIQQLRAGSTDAGGTPPTAVGLSYKTTDDVWVKGTVYAAGAYVQPTTGECPFRYECTVAGTSHASTEPTWPTTLGGTVTEAGKTTTWTCRQAGRPQLVVWPPNDTTARTMKIAYARQLPAMTAATDVPLMPAHLHRHILTGACAYGEALHSHKFDGAARLAFEKEKAEAWSKAAASSQHQVALRSHAHLMGDGGRYRVPDPTFTHD